MPSFKSSQQWFLILSIIFVIPFLALHYVLDNVARCNNFTASNDYNYKSNHGAPQTQTLPLLASSPYHGLPSTVVPNLREGIPNVLVTTRTDPPFHMFVYPPDTDRYISRKIIQHGIYEATTTQLVTNSLPLLTTVGDYDDNNNNHHVDTTSSSSSSCDINFVLDLGSNLGYYSLLAASRAVTRI
mmetsp:Transcript_15685/g.33961  ORF Transcript_15685/g.33961 Transcript_15685/m.33961 type:complete len:185 (-) Transcript_15685:1060-1614(-)